jgi:hypothetical protein
MKFGRCSSASSGAILNIYKNLKAMPMLFLRILMTNLVLTKPSGLNAMRLRLSCRFLPVSVRHRDLSVGLAVAIAGSPPPPSHSALTGPPPGFSFAEPISHGRGQIWPQIRGQSGPTRP